MLAAEPPGLGTYRSHNPGDDTALAEQAGAVWARFTAEAAYKELLDALVERQLGLCGYCEQRVTDAAGDLIHQDYQVEHVLPKSGGAGRVLDWQNVMLCCGGGTWPHHGEASRHTRAALTGANDSCGQAKGDDVLPAGTDPRQFPPLARLVEVAIDGRVAPNVAACTAAGIDPGDLASAIDDVLHLNCERLRVSRRDIASNIAAWVVPLLQEMLDDSHLTSIQRDSLISLMVASRLQPDDNGYLRAFWTTERQFLPRADPWIAANSDRLNL